MKFQLLTSLILSSILDSFSASNVHELFGNDWYDQFNANDEAVFVKFSKPGCAACKESAPVWEELATAFADNKKIVIAETVCDDSNEFCTENDVNSYPSYKYGDIFDTMGDYEGPMDLESLKKFTSENIRLRMTCTIAGDHWCNAEELLLIDRLRKMSSEEMDEKFVLMYEALEAEYNEAEQKVTAAKRMLEDSNEKLKNAKEDAYAKAAERRIEVSKKKLEDAEAAFDILMAREEPLELELMEELM
eukprot:CAMPEP_0194323150 /NCGR_PEP_ID=MMETSP0171-20130528/24211_1 /TAXON_ID=218684 /ORGANISM="Corethron pennatum, Strain L29A3" /LENGTH=246 /DNA_ID=CAMNT_0039081675 /DNA_START=31 /DNA_END=771 /DNA_ORIENTATION=-